MFGDSPFGEKTIETTPLLSSSSTSSKIKVGTLPVNSYAKRAFFTIFAVLLATTLAVTATFSTSSSSSSFPMMTRMKAYASHAVPLFLRREDPAVKLGESSTPTIVFKTLENGKKICAPLIDEEFSALVVEEGNDVSGVLTSKAECEWFNQFTEVGLEAAKMPSTCVPDDHVFATLTNDHMWEMSMYGLQHIRDEKCFTDRLVILCLDDASFSKCQSNGFKHCVKYIKALGSSNFMENDYRQIVWLKPKMALALMNARLTVFTLDSDILFFQVPDLTEIKELHPEAELHHQWEIVDYEALYKMESPNEDFEKSVRHEGYNSGQVLWMPTANVIRGTLGALLRGKEAGDGDALEQGLTRDAMREAGVKMAGLSFRYAANYQCSIMNVCEVYNKSQNWVSYHATALVGTEKKMGILRKVEEAWSKL